LFLRSKYPPYILRCRMASRLGCWLFCVAVLSIGVWAIAADPAPKAGEPAKTPDAAAKTPPAPAPKTSEPAAKPAEPAAKKPESAPTTPAPAAKACEESAPTYTVKKKPFRITFQLDGTFEAQTAQEIAIKPEEWNGLVVENAVAHGAEVHKGDTILALDTEKIDRAIADLRTELKISEITLRLNEDQLQALEKTTPLDLESSKRSARMANEDKKFFLETEKPFAVKAAEFTLKMANDNLEYEQEELRQLEKMYKADDITEETEEIVLRRARDSVAKAKIVVEYAKINHDQSLKFNIPRADEMIKDVTERRSLEWEKNKIELPLALDKQRLEIAKLRVQRERSEDKLKKLEGDREMMIVKSPIDGIVYYGKCVRGKFSDSTSLADNLRRNGVIQPNMVVMTVVQPRPLFIRASSSEELLHDLRPGLKGTATPTAFPDLKLPASVDDVSDVPVGPGSFDVKFRVTFSKKAKGLVPGMACKVRMTPYQKKDALCVPPKAIAVDELDDQKYHVFLVGKDGKPDRRNVTLGRKTDKQVEILKGLSEGDKILMEPPKDQK